MPLEMVDPHSSPSSPHLGTRETAPHKYSSDPPESSATGTVTSPPPGPLYRIGGPFQLRHDRDDFTQFIRKISFSMGYRVEAVMYHEVFTGVKPVKGTVFDIENNAATSFPYVYTCELRRLIPIPCDYTSHLTGLVPTPGMYKVKLSMCFENRNYILWTFGLCQLNTDEVKFPDPPQADDDEHEKDLHAEMKSKPSCNVMVALSDMQYMAPLCFSMEVKPKSPSLLSRIKSRLSRSLSGSFDSTVRSLRQILGEEHEPAVDEAKRFWEEMASKYNGI